MLKYKKHSIIITFNLIVYTKFIYRTIFFKDDV